MRRGKVRDMYDVGDAYLLVSTDRISAFDSVMPNPIEGKGRLLNLISAFWFRQTEDLVPNHLLSISVAEFPPICSRYKDVLRERSMLVRKTRPLRFECIVRGYLAGSGWAEYQMTGSVCGKRLRSGLREADKLEEPVFTPSTKAEHGHDVNISFADMEDALGSEVAHKVRDVSIQIYARGAAIAQEKGIIIADTKMEFGFDGDQLLLIDELMTPDSSRFWPADRYEPGRPQTSFDKQFLRDYLLSSGWDKNPPAPHLPDEIVRRTSERYQEAYSRLVS